ncbi:MAG: alanyl-tRNA editing protein [Synergistaceae bacterium]|jgi:alanyl-tRNA synthetase|nr:alanyl-tRNA editing protein [Synergistaceae bacterium]
MKMEKTAGRRTEIAEVLGVEGKKAQVVLRDCPFHPSGGGQPGDTGTLQGEDFRAEVRDAGKRKDAEGVVLTLTLTKGAPYAGMEVEAEVDWGRHAVLSRMHTAQHLFSRLQENAHEGSLTTLKVNIGLDESVIHVRYDGGLTWEDLFEMEEKTRAVIRADLPVETFITSREEAEKIPELKAKWERIHDEKIRVVRVPGVDATACSGTHSARTGQVGGFLVTGFNGSAPDWEVRFTVRQEERTQEYSRVMRRLLRAVGCRPDQAEEVFIRQRAENTALRQVLDKVRPYVSIPWEIRETGGRPLYLALLPGLTKELITAPARACAEEHPDAFCLALMPGAGDSPFPFVLLRGAQVPVDLSGFLKKFPELEARGGGKPEWLNGVTSQRAPSTWIACLSHEHAIL